MHTGSCMQRGAIIFGSCEIYIKTEVIHSFGRREEVMAVTRFEGGYIGSKANGIQTMVIAKKMA